MKKLVFLIYLLAITTISCKSAQQVVNSTFAIIEDGQTSLPENPPMSINPETGEPVIEETDERKPFPTMWFDRGNIETVVYGPEKNFNIIIRSSGDHNVSDFIKRAKVDYLYTLLERTEGTKSSEEILQNIYIKPGPFEHRSQYFLYITSGMASALGSSGQSAKIKVSLFFQDTRGVTDKNGYQPGRLDLTLVVKRR